MMCKLMRLPHNVLLHLETKGTLLKNSPYRKSLRIGDTGIRKSVQTVCIPITTPHCVEWHPEKRLFQKDTMTGKSS